MAASEHVVKIEDGFFFLWSESAMFDIRSLVVESSETTTLSTRCKPDAQNELCMEPDSK